MRSEHIELPAAAPGTRRTLEVWRFGTAGARPKAYLQAALHADEIPPMLVAQALGRRLAAAAARGEVAGEVVLVPVANPVGAGQHLLGHVQGRFDLVNGVNFNRGFEDLVERVANACEGRLSGDPQANVAAIRAAALAELGKPPDDAAGFLKHTLLRLAVDADIVLDLHCDTEAVLYLYTTRKAWPGAADLAAQLGVAVTLLAGVSGGQPFDEACSTLWERLAPRLAPHPVPLACLAATVELRGERDVDEALAERDADNLVRFLQRRGVLAGDAGELPPASEALPLAGVAPVRAPRAGVVCFLVEPGRRVRAGERLAVIVDPLRVDADEARLTVRAPIDGLVFARSDERLAGPGQVLCRIAGREALPERIGGALLSD